MDRPESGVRDCDGSDIAAIDSVAAFIEAGSSCQRTASPPSKLTSCIIDDSLCCYSATGWTISLASSTTACYAATDSSDAVAMSRNAASKKTTAGRCLPNDPLHLSGNGRCSCGNRKGAQRLDHLPLSSKQVFVGHQRRQLPAKQGPAWPTRAFFNLTGVVEGFCLSAILRRVPM